MSNNRNQEILQELLDAARERPTSEHPLPNAQSSPPHPADDDDLLLDWSLGALSAEKHRWLLEHLAACPACRREIAAMVRLGVLELPNVPTAVNEAEPTDVLVPNQPESVMTNLPPVQHSWRNRSIAVFAVALAASLLLLILYQISDVQWHGGEAVIAQAQRDWQSGRAEQAFARVEELLGSADILSAEHQRLATDLLETAGYALARDSLVQGDFHGVLEVDDRVGRHGGGSGRLVNLRIQAERGETVERSLSQRASLREHYDYELDGRQVTKSLAIRPVTETDRRIEAELRAAMARYPDEPDLLLNFGQFLLELRRFAEAEDVLAIVLEIDPNNALAHLGLGIAILEQADDDATVARALPHFQAAARLAPDDPVMKENLIIFQNRLATIGAP